MNGLETMVYDCFTFFNELDVLEIRLSELYDVVDRFVLVEATHTHKGDPKPLYFAENRQRFRAWADKIIHIVVGDLPGIHDPPEKKYTLPAIWRREMTQRQCILRGLMDAKDDDIVLISDLDEIPRRTCIPRNIPDGGVITYQQKLFYYNVNTSCNNLIWQGTRATTVADVRTLTPDGVRWSTLSRGNYPVHLTWPNAGWHLSYFGDVKHIQQKMTSFLHQELVNDETTNADALAQRIAGGQDVYGRDGQQFDIGPNGDLPLAMKTDPQRWHMYFHPDYTPQFHEDWYGQEQAAFLDYLIRNYTPPDGEVVEIGCWEGRSTVALAQSAYPRTVHAVDHWRGNVDEHADHPATVAARERNVLDTFQYHMNTLTEGNVVLHINDWREWITTWQQPIAFLHLDAAHDYASVFDCLEAIKLLLIPGAILCGDDYHAPEVHQAVHDVLGNNIRDVGGRMWVYQYGN